MQGGHNVGEQWRAGSAAVVSVVVIGVVGLIVAMMATPSVRALVIKRTISRADLLLAASQPTHAAQALEQVKPWSDCYPILTPQVNTRLVRCYAAAGDIEKATALAENIRNQQKGQLQPPNAATSTWVMFKLFEIIPNKIFNGLKQPAGFNSMQGYEALRQELKRLDRIDLLWTNELQPTPVPQIENAGTQPKQMEPKRVKMSDLIPDQARPEPEPVNDEPKMAPVREVATEPAPDDEPETTGDQDSTPSAPPPEQPMEDAQAREKALKITRLKAQQQALEEQIAKIAKDGPAPSKPLAATQTVLADRYNTASQKYAQFVEQNIKMKHEMDKASGPRRTELLDALKKRRFEEPILKRNLDKAKSDLDKAGIVPPAEAAKATEKKIRDLTRQLNAVRTELQSLEFKP